MASPFRPNDIVANAPGSHVLAGNTRVLDFDLTTSRLWLIMLPARHEHESLKNGIQRYIKAPIEVDHALYEECLKDGRIHLLNTPVTEILPDEDRLASTDDPRRRLSIMKDIQYRDKRFAVIKELICLVGTSIRKPVMEILQDKTLPKQITAQARLHGVSVRAAYHYLHLFWAGGSTKNALSTRFRFCGNPGVEKPQRRHLGRPTKLFQNGLTPAAGYALTETCKEKLKWGFRLIKHGTTRTDAYLLTMATHWANHTIDAQTGQTKAELFPVHARPSFEQFSRWGEKLNDITVTAMLLGPNKYRQKTDARGGSEQDLVTGVGQLAAFDGTSTDVYLVRLNSRLKRLPPMTRMILKEVRVGVIYGLYCGWESASPATALQTILHGANPNKVAWAKRFGVEMSPGAMPTLLARNHLADHGELKGARPTEAEEQFGFGIDCPQVMSGDRKGGVESQHRSDHAKLDHKLPGSTRGKRRERGDIAPVSQALWNYDEYMRELIEHIIRHNTVEEVPDLAPDDMLLAEPPIPLTRMNIFNWLSERGLNKSLPVSYEDMRAFCLPDVDAMIRKNGIYLVAKVNGVSQLLPRVRFTSPELVQSGLLSQVKKTGSPRATRIKMDPCNLLEAWLPTKGGMIPLFSSIRDTTINTKLTLSEWIEHLQERSLGRSLGQGQSEQAQADILMRRAATTDMAKIEMAAEIKALGKKPSQAKLKRDLRANRQDELEHLKALERSRVSLALPMVKETSEALPIDKADLELSAADLLMESLYRDGVL